MPHCDTLLRGARLADGRQDMAVAITAGRIAAILPPGAALPHATTRHDLAGDLLLPGLVEGHVHLDKTLMGTPWQDHQAEPNRMSRIEADARILPGLEPGTAERAGLLLRRCVAQGTAHFRSHADITPAFGLRQLEALLDVRDAHRHMATVQIVAFPQAGIMRAQGMASLLEDAVRAGADLIGGLDPCEVDRDPRGHLDVVFGIAERHGVGIDIHLHEPSELGLFTLQEICARVRAHGMQGNVALSHAFCLGGLAESKQQAAAALLAESGVALASHGAGGATLPPLLMLREAGVRVFLGNDSVRDTWSPYGTGDMLHRAALVGWRLDARYDRQLADLYDMVGGTAAAVLGIAGHGIAEGLPATCFSLPAATLAEAVAQHPPRRLVFFQGRLVARDGAMV